jgi:hypothetical protein
MGGSVGRSRNRAPRGGAPRLALEDIVGHPRLRDARKAYLDRFLDVYGDDPFLVRLLIESGRFLIYMIAVILDAAQDPSRRETWFTVGRLKQQMVMFGLASERQVDHLVARLCAVEFMELRPSDQDRRVRILKPTEKLRAHDRDWLAAHYTPLTVLYPQHDSGLIMRSDPEFQVVHRRTAVAFMPLGAELFVAVPDMMLFFDRAAGHMVLAALLQETAMAAPDQPHAAVAYADVGDRFGVSRPRPPIAHRRRGDRARQASRARGAPGEILPRLWSSYDRGIAEGMYLHDMIYLAAAGQRPAAQRPARPPRSLRLDAGLGDEVAHRRDFGGDPERRVAPACRRRSRDRPCGPARGLPAAGTRRGFHFASSATMSGGVPAGANSALKVSETKFA